MRTPLYFSVLVGKMKRMKKMPKGKQNWREIFAYLFYGALTTLVNIVVYHALSRWAHMGNLPSNAVAWAASVLFAFVTNRRFVFHSGARGAQAYLRELGSFVACRLGTGGVDMLLMYVAVDIFHAPATLCKILANVVVIVLNYVLSKWVIFKRGD